MHLKSRVEQFISLEVLSGLLLLIGVILALVISNSSLYDEYKTLSALPISITIGEASLSKPLIKWVNDGLMAFFFLLLTLEAKFHCLEGEFTTRSTFVLPIVAAAGGAIVPAIIYSLFNFEIAKDFNGWAIPIATDTAFVLAALSFFAGKVPLVARLFVVALSVIDDVIAVIVLAIFYTSSLFLIPLLVAIICILLLTIINFLKIGKLSVYLMIGGALWLALVEAGVHGTITGVLLGIFIPMRVKGAEDKPYSPLKKLEHFLHPTVALMILPLFAFLNSEISFAELTLNDLYSSITLGTMAGLFIGKQLGILSFTFIATKLGLCNLPSGISWRTYYGISVLCGIGFTFSLFIGILSFDETYRINQMKLGVILGSLLSAAVGIIFLWRSPVLPHVHHSRPHGGV